ncbi:hypothetical protein V8C26DRAFT_241866 [Trichoderma gracile]
MDISTWTARGSLESPNQLLPPYRLSLSDSFLPSPQSSLYLILRQQSDDPSRRAWLLVAASQARSQRRDWHRKVRKGHIVAAMLKNMVLFLCVIPCRSRCLVSCLLACHDMSCHVISRLRYSLPPQHRAWLSCEASPTQNNQPSTSRPLLVLQICCCILHAPLLKTSIILHGYCSEKKVIKSWPIVPGQRRAAPGMRLRLRPLAASPLHPVSFNGTLPPRSSSFDPIAKGLVVVSLCSIFCSKKDGVHTSHGFPQLSVTFCGIARLMSLQPFSAPYSVLDQISPQLAQPGEPAIACPN